MEKRGCKLQEFVAHASDVNCLKIGKKSCRIFVTGGGDHKVNIWAIDKPTSLLTLSGHTSSVQSVTFDLAEAFVLAGSSNGTIKLWDLEEAKIVRTITGHRSSCTAVEFHPFGEFFASGSLDTDLKIWDIRKKGCIHTYKGHMQGIRTIRFTPDGRWVVTGGEDNVVKLWDLTAGKLLHDFKFHNGTIRCIDFHPQEFLLATGSADRTVKFWDLETFELIGSAGPEASGVCSLVFHPDGRTLFCGLDETLKVFSWEPIRCHDFVNIGWSKLGDLSIYEGKILGCSYHQSRVGVWVTDISLIGPYSNGSMPKKNALTEPVYSPVESKSVEFTGSSTNTSMTLVTGSPDCGDKSNETARRICRTTDAPSVLQLNPTYSTGIRRNSPSASCQGIPQKLNEKNSSTMSPSSATTFRVGKSREMSPSTPKSPNKIESNFASRDGLLSSGSFSANSSVTSRKAPMVELGSIKSTQATGGPVSMPVFLPREYGHLENAANARKGAATTEKVARATILHKKYHMRQLSFSGEGSDCQIITTASRPSTATPEDLGGAESSFLDRPLVNAANVEADGPNNTGIKEVAKRIERTMILEQPRGLQNDKDAEQLGSCSEISSVKYVRGVAVPLGKTRSIVESWEKRERCNSSNSASVSSVPDQVPKLDRLQIGEVLSPEKIITTADDSLLCETLLQGHDVFINVVKSRLTKLQVVRHFWEYNGIKSAIDAAAKLPDLAVQVDVVCSLMVKLDLCTLDIFLLLLPLLCGLLKSKTERHATVSIEMLLELVKIFLPVILSTVTASSLLGVDLQAEQRLTRSKQCYNHLLKIRQMLPLIIGKGGQLAKNAQKLNLALGDL